MGCISTEEVFFLIVQWRETLSREFLLNREKKQGVHGGGKRLKNLFSLKSKFISVIFVYVLMEIKLQGFADAACELC